MDVENLTQLALGQNDRFIMPSVLALLRKIAFATSVTSNTIESSFGLVIIQPRNTTRSLT
jgi:hypothetical protein